MKLFLKDLIVAIFLFDMGVLCRNEKEITLRGKNIPNPIQYFSDYNFPDYVMAEIRRQGYQEPTPIQAQGWPISLQGRDFVGIAQVSFQGF